ncbi:MAG: hypothetical protein O3C21_11070 [Verrucomicrobia bacterium]|nr:hypothetical protein [Verrucomicrobiota bacterium]
MPELTNVSDEQDSVFQRYGPDSRRPGSYARCRWTGKKGAVQMEDAITTGTALPSGLPRRHRTPADLWSN